MGATGTAASEIRTIPLKWKSDDPIWTDQWPLTSEKLEAAQKIVARELEQGHLEPSNSPWNSPIFVILKKTKDSYRLLHDLRRINQQMCDFGQLQPGLPVLTALPENWPTMAVDIKDCFFSIPLHSRDRERFAFTVPSVNKQEPARRYQWTVLPQGMKNSPAICQRVVADAIAPVRTQHAAGVMIHYVDDILMAAPSAEGLQEMAADLRRCLAAASLAINEAKVQKGPGIKFLGAEIGHSQIKPLPITLNPDVRTLHDAQALVGSLQWLQNMVPITPSQMQPLYEMLKGRNPWEEKRLTAEAKETLKNISEMLSHPSVQRWDPADKITLYPVLNRQGGMAVLGQGQPERMRVIWWVTPTRPAGAFVPHSSLLARMITKGRKTCISAFAREPDAIALPFKKGTDAQTETFAAAMAMAMEGFPGEIQHLPHLQPLRHLDIIEVGGPARVLPTPKPGNTVFTDASSKTQTAAVAWQENGEWKEATFRAADVSVQYLEAKAVEMALRMFPDDHLNITTDSIFTYNLVRQMATQGWAGTPIATMLEDALQARTGTVCITHVRSHSKIPGYYQEGNAEADKAAGRVMTLREARDLHEWLHVGAKALAKTCHIPISEARGVVATCPYCCRRPLQEGGTNVRGLMANQVWQTDFTLCQRLRPDPWLAVTVDTYSGMIVATQHRKTTSRAAQKHWAYAIAVLGLPQTIKTDNGSAFTSASTEGWAQRWGIKIIHGIPYNSTGQAIVERANRTLKQKIDVLGEGEGIPEHSVIPREKQTEILQKALYALNHHLRGENSHEPVAKHWGGTSPTEGPEVQVKNPATGEWETGWRLLTQGRGYAAVASAEGGPEAARWVPTRWVKPLLRKIEAHRNSSDT
nr:PREDICTED: endogenous retrovirus group K member 11 Pol protein-like [Apteryx mantelli mantelli]